MHLLTIVYIFKIKDSNSNGTIKKKKKKKQGSKTSDSLSQMQGFDADADCRCKGLRQSFGFFCFSPAFPRGGQVYKHHFISLQYNFPHPHSRQCKSLIKMKTFSSLYNLSKRQCIKYDRKFAKTSSIFSVRKVKENVYIFENSHCSNSR